MAQMMDPERRVRRVPPTTPRSTAKFHVGPPRTRSTRTPDSAPLGRIPARKPSYCVDTVSVRLHQIPLVQIRRPVPELPRTLVLPSGGVSVTGAHVGDGSTDFTCELAAGSCQALEGARRVAKQHNTAKMSLLMAKLRRSISLEKCYGTWRPGNVSIIAASRARAVSSSNCMDWLTVPRSCLESEPNVAIDSRTAPSASRIVW